MKKEKGPAPLPPSMAATATVSAVQKEPTEEKSISESQASTEEEIVEGSQIQTVAPSISTTDELIATEKQREKQVKFSDKICCEFV